MVDKDGNATGNQTVNGITTHPKGSKVDERALAVVPAGNRGTIQAIALAYGLRFSDIVFVALRKLGMSQRSAYSFLHPDAKQTTASARGWQIEKKLKAQLKEQGKEMEDLQLEDALTVMADLTQVRAMSHSDVETALRGSDQFNKTRGRYKTEDDGGINILAILSNLGAVQAEVVDAEFTLIQEPPSNDDEQTDAPTDEEE